MKVSSHAVDLVLMRSEVGKDLPSTVGDGALHQFDQLKAAVFVGATDVRAQLLCFDKALRPLGIVHENLAPRRGEENHQCVPATGRSPGNRPATTTLAHLPHQTRQSPVSKTHPLTPPPAP